MRVWRHAGAAAADSWNMANDTAPIARRVSMFAPATDAITPVKSWVPAPMGAVEQRNPVDAILAPGVRLADWVVANTSRGVGVGVGFATMVSGAAVGMCLAGALVPSFGPLAVLILWPLGLYAAGAGVRIAFESAAKPSACPSRSVFAAGPPSTLARLDPRVTLPVPQAAGSQFAKGESTPAVYACFFCSAPA